MSRWFFMVWAFNLAAALGVDTVLAQEYPNKPIRIVAGDAGGGGDLVARLIAPGLSGSLGQPVVVDNRKAGIIVLEIVVKAPPDGYTFLVYSSSIWLLPFMRKNVPYDPVKDFSPITLALNSPNILVVHPSLAAVTVKELIALAKTKPGVLNYSSGGVGGSSHLSAELFKAMAGVNIVGINYKATAGALNALIGNEVQLMFPNVPAGAPHVKSGRLRALAITSAEPSALLPGLSTIAASGLPGYESTSMYCMFAPAKTPAAIVNRLNREIVLVLNRADVKEKFSNVGLEVFGSSPQKAAIVIKSDMAKWGKVIVDAGIREE